MRCFDWYLIWLLVEWTAQETLAFKKAREERIALQKMFEGNDQGKSEKDLALPNTSIVKNACDMASTSTW